MKALAYVHVRVAHFLYSMSSIKNEYLVNLKKES